MYNIGFFFSLFGCSQIYSKLCLFVTKCNYSNGSQMYLSCVIQNINENAIFLHVSFFLFLSGLVYSTFSLLSTIVFLILASHFNGWKLDRKFGIILLIWYFIFMIFASLYELNVFGTANLPTCDSDF